MRRDGTLGGGRQQEKSAGPFSSTPAPVTALRAPSYELQPGAVWQSGSGTSRWSACSLASLVDMKWVRTTSPRSSCWVSVSARRASCSKA